MLSLDVSGLLCAGMSVVFFLENKNFFQKGPEMDAKSGTLCSETSGTLCSEMGGTLCSETGGLLCSEMSGTV